MVYIPANFSSTEKIEKCICGEKEDMRHIYYCKYLNKREEEVIPYEEIFKEDVESQSKVYKRFENNFKQREKLINMNNENNEEIISHAILCDPLSSLLEYSNGIRIIKSIFLTFLAFRSGVAHILIFQDI